MSESRKRKLQFLTRAIARGDYDAARGAIAPSKKKAARPAEDRKPIPLEDAVGGVDHVVEWDGRQGTCWLIRRTLREIAPDLLAAQRRYAAVLKGARQQFDELEASAALCHAANARPSDLLFLDLETCGLGGTPIFLLGLMFYARGRLVFEQYFARDYSQEEAILLAAADKLAGCGVLVTFNGKSFDMTQVRDRSTFHGIVGADGPGPPHLDLLHESRRRWRGDLPNCKLQTLERFFCGRMRSGDIPGHAIPDAYHNFVASGDARRIRDILHHNMLDLLTMAELVSALLTGEGPAIK